MFDVDLHGLLLLLVLFLFHSGEHYSTWWQGASGVGFGEGATSEDCGIAQTFGVDVLVGATEGGASVFVPDPVLSAVDEAGSSLRWLWGGVWRAEILGETRSWWLAFSSAWKAGKKQKLPRQLLLRLIFVLCYLAPFFAGCLEAEAFFEGAGALAASASSDPVLKWTRWPAGI